MLAAIEQSKEQNNNFIGQFLKDADAKLQNMQAVAQAMMVELAMETKRVDERVVDLNQLKDVVLGQTANLNERSVEIERKMAENVTQHSDVITNLGEFGDKQTSDIAGLRANIEMWAVGFQRNIESHLSGMGGSSASAGGAGGAERENKGPPVDRKEVAVWKLPEKSRRMASGT